MNPMEKNPANTKELPEILSPLCFPLNYNQPSSDDETVFPNIEVLLSKGFCSYSSVRSFSALSSFSLAMRFTSISFFRTRPPLDRSAAAWGTGGTGACGALRVCWRLSSYWWCFFSASQIHILPSWGSSREIIPFWPSTLLTGLLLSVLNVLFLFVMNK